MTKFAVFLRAVNVGKRTMKMEELRKTLVQAGLREPRTLLQTGNIVVETNAGRDSLVDIVEAAVEERFGFHSAAIVRTAAEIDSVVASSPFAKDPPDEPRVAHVGFCRTPPDPEGFDRLKVEHEGAETISLGEREVFIYYADGVGRSRMTYKLLEDRLNTTMTTRNWNTVMKVTTALAEHE